MGKIKFTYREVKEYLNSLGYNLISKEYKGLTYNLIFVDNEGYYYFSCLHNIKRNHPPAKFKKSNPYTIQNIKLWCKLNDKPFELISEEYNGDNVYLKWKCLKEDCQEEFEATWNHIKYNRGCGYCHGNQVGLSNCLATKNPELAADWHPTKNGNLSPYNVTYGSEKCVWWKCRECEYEWQAIIYNRNKENGTNCPLCSISKGEKRIKKWLDINGISYIFQKEFEGLIGLGGGNLSYDFYLPQYNLLIEYDGEYHYNLIPDYKDEPIKNVEERLRKQKEHDKLKNNYSLSNSIKLLRIPYWDFDNIEEILNREIH